MKERCVLLYAMPYHIEDEKTGSIVEGVSLTYLPTCDLSPVEEEDASGGRGVRFAKQSISLSLLPKITKCPAVYDIDYKTTVSGGKLVLTPTDLNYVCDVAVVEKTANVKEGK